MTLPPTAKDRFEHLLKVIASDRFLTKQGLRNDVPFFICPYDPVEAFDMDRDLKLLVRQLANVGVTALEINLYDLSIKMLEERSILEEVFAAEAMTSKGEIKELLQGVLDPEAHIVPRIGQMIADMPHDVIFLSGVGEVYPYIRSHHILNNLQSIAKDRPTVMFFPGHYTQAHATGASLDLFGLLHDDKYYRAFNILNYEV
jgi:hypothetical protein